MSVKAFELYGEVGFRDAKLKTGLRSANKEFSDFERNARNHLGNVEKKLSSFGSNFNKGFMSSFNIQGGGGIGSLLGSGMGNLIQSGGKMLFGHVTDAISKGMEMKDLIEQMRIGFTNLTGSEETAVEHMRDMFALARDTPFKTRELLDYSQQLQAVGVGYRDVRQELTDLGDAMAKAGTFNRMDKAIMAITQMRSKGRITGEELNQQLSEALPGARGYLARGLGVSQPELNQLIEDQRVNLEPALKLMFMQMRLEAGGTMKQTATKTLAGLQSTLEDSQELLYAGAVSGGDPFGTSAGAYAQYMANRKKLIDIYGGPQAAQIAAKVGLGAQAYYGVQGWGEENMFNVSTLSPALMLAQKLMPLDSAKQLGTTLGQYLPDGMKQSLQAGAEGLKNVAKGVMGEDLWNTLSTFWETQSPSKKTMRMGEDVGDGFRIGLERALSDPRVKAMLDVIGFAEGTDKRHGYATKVGGGSQGSLDSKDRSVLYVGKDKKGRPIYSSASGRYQFLNKTWDPLAAQLGLSDFSAHSQDLAAVELLRQSGALNKLKSGDFKGAVTAAKGIWASFPGAGYGQGERSMGSLEKVFSSSLAIGGSPVTSANPVPVAVVASLGGSDGLQWRKFKASPYGGPDISGTAGFFSQTGSQMVQTGSKTINDPVPVMVKVTAALQPINQEFSELYKTTSLIERPLVDVNAAMKQHAATLDEMDALRKQAINPDATKKKKDKLFDAAFTKEGIAGDFQGGFASLLAGLGHEKPKSLLKSFGLNFLQDMQSRLAHDMSSMLTGRLFGNRGEGGKLEGGVLSSIFGKLFGGGRASGGSMSPGRFYLAGEHGPELVSGPGYVHNASQTRGMMGGSGRQEIYLAIGDEAVGRAEDRWRSQPKGRRSMFMRAKYGRKIGVGYA